MALLHWNHQSRGGVWPGGAAPHCTPGLVRLPHLIQQLHHFIIDDEDDGHIQADAAQPGDGALVESGWSRESEVSIGGRGTARGKRAWGGGASSASVLLTPWAPHSSGSLRHSPGCSCICAPPGPARHHRPESLGTSLWLGL